MSDLKTSLPFLKATLIEAAKDLNDRNTVPKGTREILRDSNLCEAVALLISKVEALEAAAEKRNG